MSDQPEKVRTITDRRSPLLELTEQASTPWATSPRQPRRAMPSEDQPLRASFCSAPILSWHVIPVTDLRQDEVHEFTGKPFDVVNIAKVEVMVGGLIGIMMIFLFTGWFCPSRRY
jgi:hypothetical protein